MTEIISYENRPYKNIHDMDNYIMSMCNALDKHDTIIHVGDLYCYTQKKKPVEFIDELIPNFINIRGNHDLNNKVKSTCESMHCGINKRYPYASVSHYPTYDAKISRDCLTAPIHICGHVHSKWKHCLDLDHHILNINVGLDAWNYQLVSDDMLIDYLNKLFKKQPNELYRCKKNEYGNLKFFSGLNVCTTVV